MACLAGLAVALVAGCEATPRSTARRPDILLISIDSLRADHVGALGYERPTTPTIDRLAAEGASFTSAISSSSWTSPAHAALLTGLSDSAHGVVWPTLRLAEGVVTLAESLGTAGYRTVGFYSGPFLDPSFGFAQGFERYVDCTSYEAASRHLDPRRLHGRSHDDRTNPNVLWNVLRELDSGDERPSFYFVHMWDVHYDLIAPSSFVEMFDADSGLDTYDGAAYRHDKRFRSGMDETLYRHVLALYDAEVRFTDETIGLILDALAKRGRLDRTLVVVTSDHGDEFLDHGGKGHRHSLYQELLRVPLVFRLPGVIAAGRYDEPVSLVDVAPTILDIAGVEQAEAVSGRSLAAGLRSGEEPSPAAVIAELTLGLGRKPGAASRSMSAILEGGDKLIVGPQKNRAVLFDLSDDPGETRPTPGRSSERGRDLEARLEELQSRARALGQRHGGPDSAALGAALESRLDALGYLDR